MLIFMYGVAVTCLVRLAARLFIAVMTKQKRTNAACSQARSSDEVWREDGDDQKRRRLESWTSPTRSLELLQRRDRDSRATAPIDAEQLIPKEIWHIIIRFLAVSPMTRMNGIAVTSRLMNVRWRMYHRSIVREFIEGGIQVTSGTEAHLLLIDLEDIIF